MFFYRKPASSGHVLQLLESRRRPDTTTPRQRVVVSLGDMPMREEWYRPLARLVETRLRGELGLPDASLPPEALRMVEDILLRIERREPAAAAAVSLPQVPADGPQQAAGPAATAPDERVLDGVLLDRVNHSHDTAVGPLVCALWAWETLGMPRLLLDLGFNEAQRQAAAALVTSRLIEPMSENAFVEWLPFSSFPDLLGPEVLRGGTDRYYRVGDRLFADQARIEAHVRDRVQSHFGFERTILLCDLTNFHFEGVCAGNPKARRGHNKQKRNDCPQVVVGMVFDEHGFELAYRTFAGNTGDAKALPDMIREMQAICPPGLLPAVSVTVILDGGLASQDNKAAVRRAGFHFLVNDRRTTRADWREEFAKEGFVPVAAPGDGPQVMVRDVDLAESGERLLLCKSAGRREKELAIRSRAEVRLREDLEKLQRRMDSGRLTDPAAGSRALGRLLARNPRVARYYDVRMEAAGAGLRLIWGRRDELWQQQDELDGCYVLRTSRTDISGPAVWKLYMTLCKAEEGFRMVKCELGLRPNHHQIEPRVDTHTFITILAYQLLRFILYSLEKKGDCRRWTSLRRLLATHCYATLHLPTRDGQVVRLRKPGLPEVAHWDVYRKLGIDSLSHLPVTELRQASPRLPVGAPDNGRFCSYSETPVVGHQPVMTVSA